MESPSFDLLCLLDPLPELWHSYPYPRQRRFVEQALYNERAQCEACRTMGMNVAAQYTLFILTLEFWPEFRDVYSHGLRPGGEIKLCPQTGKGGKR